MNKKERKEDLSGSSFVFKVGKITKEEMTQLIKRRHLLLMYKRRPTAELRIGVKPLFSLFNRRPKPRLTEELRGKQIKILI